MPAWYDQAFGPWYLKLYPHRNREEAEAAVGVLAPWVDRNSVVLDVGCGPGRHLVALRARGYTVFGLDRSAALLAEAARDETAAGRLVRGDMRALPVATGALGAVLSMFTSFGYFDTRGAHRELLQEYARVTRGGGALVLDYLNAVTVRQSLVPRSRRTVSGHEVIETRSIVTGAEGDAVVKDVLIRNPEGREVERYQERVSLYSREDLQHLLENTRWSERACLGDYTGAPWSPESPRLIVVAARRNP